MFARAARVRRKGWKRYPGNAKRICTAIIRDCYDTKQHYFRTSTGHFCQFYARDFGMCCESLLKRGYAKQVHATLEYALLHFSAANKITTAITPDGVPFDYPRKGIDSLAFLIHALRMSKAKKLVKQHSAFLEGQIKEYAVLVRDCLIRDDVFLSSINDSIRRASACYDNCMLAMLNQDCTILGLRHPFTTTKEHILKEFWNGEYFFEDRTKKSIVSGDANVFPFWCGIINDRALAKKVIARLAKERLDSPFLLKYTTGQKHHDILATNLFAHNYEGDTVWGHLGLCYLDVLHTFDKKRFAQQLTAITKLVEHNQNFLEVFNADGTPYNTPFYYADEGMLWSAKLLGYLRGEA
ncbi:MAG: hypothetical protein V1725_05635 [archaeon]